MMIERRQERQKENKDKKNERLEIKLCKREKEK
jgi:hypothetical protein